MSAVQVLVTLLLVAQHVSGRLAPATKAHRQLLQGDSAAPTPDLSQQIIPGRYILQLAEDVTDAAAAGEALVSEVQAALDAAAPSVVSSGAASAAAGQAGQLTILRTMGSSSSDEGYSVGAATAAVAASGSAATPSLKSLLVSAPDSAVQHIKASKLVKAVVKDRLIAHQQTALCVQRAELQKDLTAVPHAAFKWEGCMTPRTKLLWRGNACGAGKISYTMIRALDKVTLKPIRVNGAACIMSLATSTGDATFNRQRFGSCGISPTFARSLPNRICTATGGNLGTGGGKTTGVPPNPNTLSPVLPRTPVATSEQIPAGVARIEAASAATGAFNTAGLPAGQQVAVGVVDSGIDGTHPDLNLVGGLSWVTPSTRVAGDVADADVDRYGHGTHVAGIIGALNNGAGVVGVAPGTPLFSLKVLDGAGTGALSDAMAAVEWAASSEGQSKANIKVINLSLAAYISPTDPDYQATLDLVCASFKVASDAGIVVVAAAGNYASDMRGYLPASCPTVVAVTSMDPGSNSVSSFSNYLPTDAEPADKARLIAAPGNAILSTISYYREASGYRELSGTSMASPHVAGVAATCFMSGSCSSSSSSETGISQLMKLQAAASERLGFSAGYGFAGDAASIINGKFYGNLLWAKF